MQGLENASANFASFLDFASKEQLTDAIRYHEGIAHDLAVAPGLRRIHKNVVKVLKKERKEFN